MNTQFNFADDPGRLTEERFFSVGSPHDTWMDAVNRGNQEQRIDSLEKLARSFGSPVNHVKPTAVEKTILGAGDDAFSLDQRGEISNSRRSENVPVTEFLKIFRAPEPGSSFSLKKTANHHGDGVARVERDELPDGSFSVSEYSATGALLRCWIDDGDGKPTMMKTIVPTGDRGPAAERVLLPSAIFERRDVNQ